MAAPKPTRAIVVMIFEVETHPDHLERAADAFCDEIAGAVEEVPKVWAMEGTAYSEDEPDTNLSMLESVGGNARILITNSMVMIR